MRIIKAATKRGTREPARQLRLEALISTAGIDNKLGNHSFRATGISPYREWRRARSTRRKRPRSRARRATKLYDRTNERLTQDEVERIRL